MKKQNEDSHEGITWSEMGKQNVQAEKVYKGKVVVTGKRVNRRAGYGLEIPSEYIFFFSIPWLKSKIESLGYKLD